MRFMFATIVLMLGAVTVQCSSGGDRGSCFNHPENWHFEQCWSDFTRDECKAWDPDHGPWEFRGESCPELGYPALCETGPYTTPSVAAWCSLCRCSVP